jgi:hypothetical protein
VALSLQRLARNQALFREVNERIKEIGSQLAGDFEFICECSNPDCTVTMVVPMGEYETIRSNPASFVIAPGHQVDDIERVTREEATFAVVEKAVDKPFFTKTDPRRSP